MPYGAFNGLAAVAVPYLLRKQGLSVDRIASIGAMIQLPAIWYFLWAPAIDLKLRRRTWIILLAMTSGACAAFALTRVTAGAIGVLTGLFIAASALNQPVSSAVGGLVAAVVPSALRGRTGGWSQAGILLGGIAAGGLSVWLADRASLLVVAGVAAVLVGLPSLAALAIDEPIGARHIMRAQPKRMARELWTVLKQRRVWAGFLFFLSPIGASALMNLFTAVAGDFHASPNVVVSVVAIAGVLTPAGALIGGYLCDRFNRWLMYPVGGLLAAASAGGMLVAPLSPWTYAFGAAAYALATGFCYATFMSLALELLGAGASTSGTQFTLFMAAVNVPVAYMLRLDGLGHAHFGARGMLAVDAGANAAFGLAFLIVLSIIRPRSYTAEAPPATPHG